MRVRASRQVEVGPMDLGLSSLLLANAPLPSCVAWRLRIQCRDKWFFHLRGEMLAGETADKAVLHGSFLLSRKLLDFIWRYVR